LQIEAIIAELEQSGVVLAALGDEVRLRAPADRVPSQEVIAQLRQQKATVLAYLRGRTEAGRSSFSVVQAPMDQKTEKPTPARSVPPLHDFQVPAGPQQQTIPPGALLRAPRFNGGSEPLDEVPACWCCHAAYRLARLQEGEGQACAWLVPSCECLDVPQALSCCGLCVEHCRCSGE
jgi:hypothetical protein